MVLATTPLLYLSLPSSLFIVPCSPFPIPCYFNVMTFWRSYLFVVVRLALFSYHLVNITSFENYDSDEGIVQESHSARGLQIKCLSQQFTTAGL